MNGTIKLKLPYPRKVGFITFFISREIGFSFDQRTMFQLLRNNDIDLPNHSEWLKNTNQSKVVLETIFAAAQSYCIERREKDNFTKEGLSKSLTEAGEDATNKIVQCWKDAEHFGNKKIPSKKKAVSH